jgi:hypothetical protein
MFDGRLWSVVEWLDGDPVRPTNEQLGIRTVSRSTANWAGRIDEFQVFRDKLYLFKVEAELPEEDANLVPFGARKEILIIYEPLEVHGQDGLKMTHREHRYTRFIFDDLEITYTGRVVIEHPVWDPWDFPWPLDEAELDPIYRATLEFEDGLLTDASVDSLNVLDANV